MPEEEKVEPYYRRQAKDLTDFLFDKGFLQPMLTRASVNWLEDYLGFLFQSQCKAAARAAVLTAKIRHPVASLRGEENEDH